MNRFILLIPVFLLVHIMLPDVCTAYYDNDYKAVSPILGPAEKFFSSLQSSEYGAAWDLLSEKSHEVIIDDVYKASRKVNGELRKEDISNDFNNKGIMFTNYWKSFMRRFDTEMILEKSQWAMGVVNNDKAEIIITYNNSHRPTILTMHKQRDSWKVGLVETFWQRKIVSWLRLFQ